MTQFSIGDTVRLRGTEQDMRVIGVNEKSGLLHCEWEAYGAMHRIYVPSLSVESASPGPVAPTNPDHLEIRT